MGSVYFKWLVEKVADLAIEQALHGRSTIKAHKWSEFLNERIVIDRGLAASRED